MLIWGQSTKYELGTGKASWRSHCMKYTNGSCVTINIFKLRTACPWSQGIRYFQDCFYCFIFSPKYSSKLSISQGLTLDVFFQSIHAGWSIRPHYSLSTLSSAPKPIYLAAYYIISNQSIQAAKNAIEKGQNSHCRYFCFKVKAKS